eukprot:Filipodium_phascolosomae@DN1321_c0_g1_i3.p1
MLTSYRHKVGGHTDLFKIIGTDCILKVTTKNEVDVYQRLRHQWMFNSFITSHLVVFTPENDPATQMLILKDLNEGLVRPCILDLKMGRIQRTPNSSKEKRVRQIIKSMFSTSFFYGFRPCGFQHSVLNRGLWKDCSHKKDEGRFISGHKILALLELFFWDGENFRVDVLRQAIWRLKQLEESLASVVGIAFNSTDLLLIYDGGRPDSNCTDVRLIDFANCIIDDDIGADLELMWGLSNFCVCLECVFERRCNQSISRLLPNPYIAEDDIFCIWH